jgi:hypothetical protein
MRCGFKIQAERLTWNGASGEFVVRHIVKMAGGDDLSQDIHVRIERVGDGFRYTRFRARGADPLGDLETENPFAVAARGQLRDQG